MTQPALKPRAVLLWQHAPLSAGAVQPQDSLDERTAFGFITDIEVQMLAKESDYL